MRSVPVGSLAPGTAQEEILILINILRNKVPCFFPGDAIEEFIALGAAGEGIERHFTGESG